MNVEINLLPKKPEKKRLFFYIVISLLIMLLIGFTMAFVYQQNLEREERQLDADIETILLLQEAERGQEQSSASEEQRLEKTVDVLESQRRSTTRLLDLLVKKLPERGFFTRFEFQEPGTVNLDVQFETQREAASYLHALNDHFIVEEAMINDVTTEELILNEDEQNQSVLPRYNASYTISIYMPIFSSVERWDDLEQERSNLVEEELDDPEQESDDGDLSDNEQEENRNLFSDDEIEEGGQ
ncbi:PilN domain-containing protein [Salipaludibacillus daqingensis]|uniref:PilN domain-containing protein n=1 Tax=Salipaludibacillus daqingensis TaxID=3041001 RepID=UPI002475E96A|nr:hypothetical protein [Salipaludibacillus daqingensis]